ncbi:Cytochrome b5 [Schizosaccharomyces pombe]|uniref:Probable cytochrome b5 2 n=1 Tax=Schizosaccharomyces pombe (strain 972 / ATCC 24843) TaxID=284812 RepID=CYB52_SCHPO|nr:putative cytochrome b5 [Schizosaccharomyces pombe]Q9USM6.1 RecName: Full=Probable cytochrome b5 2 [Schizosaccharomyces pombe 972h-]CAB53082.1 cytochrome b5 (predicted) [Schizosaccharomyces pombe]|eukprot:NP_587997.1 putative cytochrome b5 [Schizosaccharomyces pombe]
MAEKTITVEEVLKHNTRDDLYIVVKDKVYDISKFLDAHPGGEEVLVDLAGRDASGPFEDVGHSEDAQELLEKFYIGNLLRTEDGPQLPTTGAAAGGSGYDSSQPVKPAMWLFVLVMVVAYFAFRKYVLK